MTEQINIQKGFLLVERKSTLPFTDASFYLTSRRARHVTRAAETELGVEITRHAHRCPYCGKEIFAYDYETPLPSREDVGEWCNFQLNMFSNDFKAPLEFQEPFTNRKEFFCTRCKNLSEKDDGVIPLTLEIEKNEISLSRPVEDLDQLLAIPWLKVIDLSGNETLTERITFDFESASARLSLEDENGSARVLRMLKQGMKSEEIGFFGKMLSEHRIVKRKVKNAFQSFCKNPIPFSLKELDFNHFLLLTMFSDFPREFFNAVPWDFEAGWIMEDFLVPASLLRSPEQALKALAETGLPKTKSVRRIFAQKPGLFFYLPECKKLWDTMEDLNLFCALLRADNVFYLLASLHQYPALLTFYQDYGKLCGTRSLLKILKNNAVAVNNRAVAYASLSACAKEKIQRRIKENRDSADLAYVRALNILFSYPLLPLPKGGKEVAIDGFTFKWLKNTADCRRAGIELDNCLTEWNGMKNPVAVVLCGREYVAAIEVADGEVLQFLGRSNKAVDEDSPLCNAFKKWARLFAFKAENISYDDLPF